MTVVFSVTCAQCGEDTELDHWKGKHPEVIDSCDECFAIRIQANRPYPSGVAPWPDTKCPICGKQAVYSYEVDRFFHADGSDNRDCRTKIMRGEYPGNYFG